MENISRQLFFLCGLVFFLLAFLLFSERQVQARNDDGSVTLVFVSHLADIQRSQDKGGVAELAGLINQLRAEGKNVVLIHGGNSLGPSAMSSLDKGAHMIGLLNE